MARKRDAFPETITAFYHENQAVAFTSLLNGALGKASLWFHCKNVADGCWSVEATATLYGSERRTVNILCRGFLAGCRA